MSKGSCVLIKRKVVIVEFGRVITEFSLSQAWDYRAKNVFSK